MADFEIFRSRQNDNHYVAVVIGDREGERRRVRRSQNLASSPASQTMAPHHLVFNPLAAKATIGTTASTP